MKIVQLKITNQEDFWAGLMFVGFGLLAVFLARDYPYGMTSRMGPGYFPTWLGITLAVLGLVLCIKGVRTVGEPLKKFAFKAMFVLSLGFIAFGWAIDNLGFVIAAGTLVVLAAAAGKEFRYKEVIVMMILLIVGSWAVFIHGLGLPYPLFWWR